MSERTILVWFRNDLRIHDNEVLAEAVKKGERVLPVYCFDPRYFSPTPYGTIKTGYLRTRFLLESVAGLRQSLRQKGGDLLIVHGKPEEVLPKIAADYQVHEVYHHREVASEETEISALVEAALWKMQLNLKHFIGHTLYHKEDLPFPIKDIPDTFTVFRKKIERESEVRKTFPTPETIRIPQNLQPSELPSLQDLGLEELPGTDGSAFRGGEAAGLQHLQQFAEETHWQDYAKNMRKQQADAGYSSQLSAWLSLGCLSAREVYWTIRQLETEPAAPFILQLLWRDYFRFMFKKHENRFSPKGFFNTEIAQLSSTQQQQFEKWKTACTGIPIVDACMHELNYSGYLSHKKRQVAASFLANNLPLEWAYGASYFEERLIDYSPASNWGNWALVAGKGSDSRQKEQYDILKQALELDPQGDFVRSWLPRLSDITGSEVHYVQQQTQKN